MARTINQQILNSSGVSEGQWLDIGALEANCTLVIYGFNAGDAAQIYVSNRIAQPALAPPAAGDGSVKLGNDVTSDLGVIINADWRWIRVRKSAAGATPATTQADFKGYAANLF